MYVYMYARMYVVRASRKYIHTIIIIIVTRAGGTGDEDVLAEQGLLGGVLLFVIQLAESHESVRPLGFLPQLLDAQDDGRLVGAFLR